MSPRARLWLFRLLGGLLERLPERLDVRVGEVVAGTMGRAPRWRHQPLATNLARALAGGTGEPPDPGVLDRYVTRAMHTYGRYWTEGAKLPALPRSTVTERIRFSEGEHHLRDAVHAGRGALLALPHVGSWEWGGTVLADLGWPMTAVAERLEPPALFDWFAAKRVQMGLGIIPLDDAAGGAVARVLRAGGVVGLLSDRDLQQTGLDVQLFGAPTTVPAGPAMLALRTGATLLCAAVYSGPGRDHHIVITPPVDTTRRGRLRDDVARITQCVTDELGWLIRRAPEQWHVLQANWPDAA
ncbi:MAG TPA: phosphatidylinositol mannoside acyltransferase [Acidimicrobiales bacterium]|nr:phosphatidylinositol mannoside acyltransferase [Acidimicrobiales bacterium]